MAPCHHCSAPLAARFADRAPLVSGSGIVSHGAQDASSQALIGCDHLRKCAVQAPSRRPIAREIGIETALPLPLRPSNMGRGATCGRPRSHHDNRCHPYMDAYQIRQPNHRASHCTRAQRHRAARTTNCVRATWAWAGDRRSPLRNGLKSGGYLRRLSCPSATLSPRRVYPGHVVCGVFVMRMKAYGRTAWLGSGPIRTKRRPGYDPRAATA